MQWIQKYIGGSLVAASGFGLTVAAATPLPHPTPAATAGEQAVLGSSAGPDRLAEIKVELAWLADPATFTCQLAVRASNGVMEVGGVIHGEQVRKRVLQIAGDHGGMPVRDKLTVLPAVAPRPPARDNGSQLCRNAVAAMSRLTAGKDGQFDIAADPSGQITISGPIGSCEEKLKVSRHLSQLPGCTAVANNLLVANDLREGRVHTVVSADGRLTVPGDPRELFTPLRAPSPIATSASAPVNLTTETAKPPTVLTPVQTAKDSPYTSQLQNFAPPANQYGGATAVTAATPRYSPPAAESTVVYQAAATYTPPAPTPTTIARSTTYGGAFNPVPPATKPAATANNPTGGPIQQVAAKMPDQTANLKPAAVKPVKVSPDQLADLIRQRIETAFRGSVRDVMVQAKSEKELQIRLSVVRASDGPAIGRKIMNLPELAPYKVDLQIPVQ